MSKITQRDKVWIVFCSSAGFILGGTMLGLIGATIGAIMGILVGIKE